MPRHPGYTLDRAPTTTVSRLVFPMCFCVSCSHILLDAFTTIRLRVQYDFQLNCRALAQRSLAGLFLSSIHVDVPKISLQTEILSANLCE